LLKNVLSETAMAGTESPDKKTGSAAAARAAYHIRPAPGIGA